MIRDTYNYNSSEIRRMQCALHTSPVFVYDERHEGTPENSLLSHRLGRKTQISPRPSQPLPACLLPTTPPRLPRIWWVDLGRDGSGQTSNQLRTNLTNF